MPISEKAFRKLALRDPKGFWELHCGEPRQKPPMSVGHNHAMAQLFLTLGHQLDLERFTLRSNAGHVRRSSEHYYIPDLFVIPIELERALLSEPRALEVYEAPLPLVVEIWSPSTGTYDIESKLPEYQQRGDLEIWRIHPFERTLTAWRRQSDGTYTETFFTGGVVRPVALPNVSIDLDALFD